MSEYYIFGLQRSGTNYIETLIANNFKDIKKKNPATRSWKHSIDIPKETKKNVPLVVLYKNPYTWVESIVWRNRVDWIKTQRKYSSIEQGEFMIGSGQKLNLTNVIKTYKHFQETWLGDKAEEYNRFIVRYEDLLIDSSRNEILNKIQNKFNLKKKHNNWKNPGIGTISQSKDYTSDRQKYYESMKPKKLEKHHIEEINRVLGKEMFDTMKYEML